MSNTYLQVEGINIYPNVLDTNQLSVIRGSSFILKQAIDMVKDDFTGKIEPITTGASRGLFLVNEGVGIDDLVANITEKLETSPYCHFTFAIEHCRAEDLLQAKEQLLAQLRFNQLSGITMVPDHFNEEHFQENHPCELEGHRIAATNTKRMVQGALRKLSHSICDRLDFGRKQRQGFYFEEGDIDGCAELEGYRFTDDLENLADDSRYSKLKNKIAVIYMDGNKFSSIQREMLKNAQRNGEDPIARQKEFDDYIKEKRSTFLKNILLEMVSWPESPRFQAATTQNNDAIRFETLLWGGDEMLFVLPAWSGFELLQSFFQESADWKIGEEPLTHAAGIVFCSAKTPIRVIRDIAQSLADTIKDGLGDDRKKNTWDYMVLESIDYPVSNDIKEFNKGCYGEELAGRRPPYYSPATDWDEAKSDLARLITGGLLSRRQLYRIVDAVNNSGNSAIISWATLVDYDSKELDGLIPPASPQERAEHRLLQLLDREQRLELAEILPQLAKNLFSIDIDIAASRAWLWLNLIELWDYLVPERED